MIILENQSLKSLNSFGFTVKTRYMAEISGDEEVIPLLKCLSPDHHPLLILGRGSNILFTADFPGTVIHLLTKGIKVVDETKGTVCLRIAGGETWDDLVRFCVERNWGGVENLSMIPGTVGAAPVQNIGAYGAEIQDVAESVEAIHLGSGEKRIFTAAECGFGYRTSVFKTLFKDQYLILNVILRVSKKPEVNLDYGIIRQELESMQVSHPKPADVREAVCRIRRKKLPDPAALGNAGSFFKNPVIGREQFAKIAENHPSIRHYPDPDGVKIAAAWLIGQCGWKGKRAGDAGVHPGQPLVLVNHGNATGRQILDLATLIRQSVYARFGILLEPEVLIL
jgi:UDP-N-acetylmuramate dehydrogenase